ncbi:MAG: GDSL-type esterase/lipase family protein [Candidatus Curtissbacteria bacterium]|nr:GDSL-type esterase/lipase family protein [Candidatus Curtissbacteria bacterium]
MLLRLLKNPLPILILTLLIVIPFVGYNLIHPPKNSRVLSVNTQSPSPSPTPTPVETPTNPSPSPTPIPKLSKSTYSIAIFGDSMVDTMGENLEYLDASLKARYPQTNFKLYNYGIGGQNVADGLARFDQPFTYQTRNFPSISQVKPDIMIIASFAYNPFPTHDRDRHWLTLTDLVNRAKNTGSTVYMLAEIAPLKTGFGKGPGGINWPEDIASTHASHIIEQLQNAVNLSKNLGIPAIDAFDKSKVSGNWGDSTLVSSHDGIHPSQEGHMFTADLIATIIKLR